MLIINPVVGPTLNSPPAPKAKAKSVDSVVLFRSVVLD